MPNWLPYLISGALVAIAFWCHHTAPHSDAASDGRASRPGHCPPAPEDQGRNHPAVRICPAERSTAKGRGQSRLPPAIGAPICVLYDPENPRRNAPYPLTLVKLTRSLNTP